MEDVLTATDKQNILSSFLEIAVGQTVATATRFLQATCWNLEEAVLLFYVENENGPLAPSSNSPANGDAIPSDDISSGGLVNATPNENIGEVDEVRAPLPVIREVLYDHAMMPGVVATGYPQQGPSPVIAFRNFNQEMRRPGVWEPEQGDTSTADTPPRDNLASLYRPPLELMHHGSFEQAKVAASVQDKWLIVNLQSTKEFSSHTLNRDTWANEAVAQTVKTNFIFWQIYEDTGEGRKVCTYYKVDTFPAVLVVDPITGQKMHSWSGAVQPERLLEDLLPFLDGDPKDHHTNLSHKRPREPSLTPPHKVQVIADHSSEEDKELQRALEASLENIKDLGGVISKDEETINADKEEETINADKEEETVIEKKLSYPPLPVEPVGDKTTLCRVGVRLPDGRRVQRNFLRTDSIQLLWSFCSSLLGEDEARSFHLARAMPGAKSLDYSSDLTFAESDLSNSMVSVTWD